MPQLLEKNNFVWLTIAMIGVLVTGAFSRELPDAQGTLVIQAAWTALLLLALLSLKTRRSWSKWLLGLVGLMILMALARHAT